jgi:hypothetical protein
MLFSPEAHERSRTNRSAERARTAIVSIVADTECLRRWLADAPTG